MQGDDTGGREDREIATCRRGQTHWVDPLQNSLSSRHLTPSVRLTLVPTKAGHLITLPPVPGASV